MVTYDLGDEREFKLTTALSGTPTDPDVLIFKIREPDNVITTYVKSTDAQVEKVSDGVWRVLWICRKAGTHSVRMRASGNINQAETTDFVVAVDPVVGSILEDLP